MRQIYRYRAPHRIRTCPKRLSGSSCRSRSCPAGITRHTVGNCNRAQAWQTRYRCTSMGEIAGVNHINGIEELEKELLLFF